MNVKRLKTYFIEPKSKDPDSRRREFILNVLLIGLMFLAALASVIVSINYLRLGENHEGANPLIVLAATLFFVMLYLMSRLKYSRVAAVIFILLCVVLGAYTLLTWGFFDGQGLLMQALVIVMAGVLVGSRFSFFIAALISVLIIYFAHLQTLKVIEPVITVARIDTAIVYSVTLTIIALVAWLSNREIERSLKRARRSEAELKRERDQLEDKVAERTTELEQAQAERMLELYRFAEFGRVSSTLMHDLVDPLTATKLNLEQVGRNRRGNIIKQISEGIDQMEKYVVGARQELRDQREISEFDVALTIKHIVHLHAPKAKHKQVRIKLELQPGLVLRGDKIQFDHIVSNLLSNSIDAYFNAGERIKKPITISTKQKGKWLEITVRDYGVGISRELLDKIFRPFYSTKENDRGTGIGLAITKQAVEKEFSGDIKATSTVRGGTRFIVRLPLT